MNEFFAAHQQAFAYLVQAVRTCLLLVFIVAVFAPLEHLFAVRRERLLYKGWAVNFGWYFVNGFTTALLLVLMALPSIKKARKEAFQEEG